jgi:hypothetical protein
MEEVPTKNKVANKIEINSEVQEMFIGDGEKIYCSLKKYPEMKANGM